jgi:hypothetical protein
MTSPRAIVSEQAEDPALWFEATRAPERYLQMALRRLHAAVEAESVAAPAERAIWLRREGDHFIVLVEHEKQWIEVIREFYDCNASHIVEPLGIQGKIDRALAKGKHHE